MANDIICVKIYSFESAMTEFVLLIGLMHLFLLAVIVLKDVPLKNA